MTAVTGSDHEKLDQLCQFSYKNQAIFFLNGYWNEHNEECEKLWDFVQKANDLDLQDGENGCGLDELNAHRFLETFNETLTVREMRTELRASGAIGEKERVKAVPLIHILIFKYRLDWHKLVNSIQGDNKKELEEAQAKLDAVLAALQESETKANESKAAEAEAKESAAEAAVKEAEAKAAQDELAAALAELKAQEDAYNQKTETLTKKSEEGGVVTRNRAKNELAQHLAEDPLPLRRAKINQEAAVRKAEKAAKASSAARAEADKDAAEAETARAEADKDAAEAEAARAQAEQDRAEAEQAARAAEQARAEAEQAAAEATAAREAAEQARAASEQAKEAAEAALNEARTQLAEAETLLEEIKSKPGSAQGTLWWINRELHEQKKYLPESKGGIRR